MRWKESTSPVLRLLRACKTIRDLSQVHSQIIRGGCEQDNFLITLFVSLCATFVPSDFSYPSSVFDCVSNPNIYVWNTMLKFQCENSSVGVCFSFFKRMRRDSSVVPDKYTFPSLIKLCSSRLCLREGRVVHAVTVRCGSEDDVFVASSLIDFYGKCGEMNSARQVFDGMPLQNEVSWTAMMVGYLNFGDLGAAERLFEEMPMRNNVAWNAMLKGMVKFGDLSNARKLFDSMPSKNEVSFTILIDGLAKAGDMAAARALFNILTKRDLVSWSALMSGYVQNGRPGEALNVFGEMMSANVSPDEFVIVNLMSACSQLGSSELANWIESFVNSGSFDLRHPHVVAALVDMNAKCGNMERATLLFDKIPKRDLILYCTMMQGLNIHGNSFQAVELFERMINEGIRPDDVAFTIILTTCCRAGLVDDGCRYFDLMIHEYSVTPSPDHYACMVNLLGKAGKLKAAYDLIRSTPVESHGSAWGALLGACRLHCDVDLGEEVAHRLFELEPRGAGNYVLLSHIYAEADRWLDVFRLRDQMSERGVQKIPGFSYIESATPS